MSAGCENLFSELSKTPGDYSPEFVQHLLICTECQQNLKALQVMKQHRTALTSEELAEVGKIVSSPAALAILGTSVTQAATIVSAGKLWAVGLIAVLSLTFGVMVFSPESLQNITATKLFPAAGQLELTEQLEPVVTPASLDFIKAMVISHQQDIDSHVTKEVLAMAERVLITFQAYQAMRQLQNEPSAEQLSRVRDSYLNAVKDLRKILNENPEFMWKKTEIQPPKATMPTSGESEDAY